MVAQYNFDDVQKLINDNKLHFSDADLKLAQKNPNVGMTIANYKIDYANATTDDQRALANAGAEQTRKDYGNYTGGVDGSRYYMTSPSPNSYYDKGFENPYQTQYDDALNNVLNRQQFSYDPETDPLYQSARQMYLREADRATQDTLGQAAAMTGGIASTAAINAASQAGDYYRSQMNDDLMNYANFAKQNNVDEAGFGFDTFSMLNDLRNQSRSEYDTDRNFGYNQWTDELGFRADEEAQKLEQENYKTEYGDALSLDVLNQLQAQYEANPNAETKKRIDAILNELYGRLGL